MSHLESSPVMPLRSQSQFVHGAYYPSWRVYRGAMPSSINLAITTHLFYAFARVHPDGTVHHLDEKADLQLPVEGSHGCIHNCCHYLKQRFPSLSVILSVGGGSGSSSFPQLASSEEARNNFARSVCSFIDDHGFDGVDIDWEHPVNQEQGKDYVLLLQTLRRHFPSERTLSSALPAGEWCLQHIDVVRAAESLDLINLMCYDFAGPWTERSGHHAQLYPPSNPRTAFAKRSGDTAVRYLLSRGIPSFKIVMGIPAYGRSFLGVHEIGQLFSGHGGEQGTYEFRDLPRPNAIECVDTKSVAAYCMCEDGEFVSYDTPETVTIKAQYAKSMGLAGLFYWTGVGDATGTRSLMAAGFEAMCDASNVDT